MEKSYISIILKLALLGLETSVQDVLGGPVLAGPAVVEEQGGEASGEGEADDAEEADLAEAVGELGVVEVVGEVEDDRDDEEVGGCILAELSAVKVLVKNKCIEDGGENEADR